jgi:hypothetical protein
MAGRVVATVVVVVLIVGVVAAGYITSRRRADRVRPGQPDRVSETVVAELMDELRKAQAEAAYWKTTAERLQRRIDASPPSDG